LPVIASKANIFFAVERIRLLATIGTFAQALNRPVDSIVASEPTLDASQLSRHVVWIFHLGSYLQTILYLPNQCSKLIIVKTRREPAVQTAIELSVSRHNYLVRNISSAIAAVFDYHQNNSLLVKNGLAFVVEIHVITVLAPSTYSVIRIIGIVYFQ